MKNIKNFLLPISIIAILVIAIFGLFSLQKSKSKETYTIGAIIPLTGGGATLGTSALNGMNLAVEEINNMGGINGRKIKLVAQDSKLDAKASVDGINFLLNTEKLDIVSSFFHLPTQAISPILKNAKIPFIYEAYTRSILEDNPYALKANFDALMGCEKLIDYVKKNNKYKKLGVLMSKVEYNDLCIQGIKKVEPNINEYRYNFGETDFKTLFLKAKNDGIDSLVALGLDFEYLNMFKQLSELKYPIKMICATASECIFPEVIKSASPEILNNTFSIDFVSMNIDKTEFAQKYSQKYPNASLTEYVYAAFGYEEIQYISQGMEDCRPADHDCLLNSIQKVKDYRTVIGSNGFKDRVLQLTDKIYEFEDGGWKIKE